jgi:hypothetical protein
VSGTIIRGTQITSLNIPRHPSNKGSQDKRTPSLPRPRGTWITIRPRLRTSTAQLCFARAQPWGNSIPTWVRNSPEGIVGQETHVCLTWGHLGRGLGTIPASADFLDPRTCPFNAVYVNTCPALGTKVNKGWHDPSLNLPFTPTTTVVRARIRGIVPPLRPLLQLPRAWLHVTLRPSLVLGRDLRFVRTGLGQLLQQGNTWCHRLSREPH